MSEWRLIVEFTKYNRFLSLKFMSIDTDKAQIISAVAPIFFLYVSYAIKFTFNIEANALREGMTVGVMLLSVVLFCISYSWSKQKAIKNLIFSYFFLITLILVNALVFSEKFLFTTELIWPFTIGLPIMLALSQIKDFSKLREILRVMSRIILTSSVVPFFAAIGKGDVYDMVLSYHLLLPILVLVSDIAQKRYIISSLVLVLIGLMIIISFGSRGPMFVLVLFILAFVAFNSSLKFSSKLVMLFMMIVVSIVGSLFFESTIKWLIDILARFDVESRFLNTFVIIENEGKIAFLTGRELLYLHSIELIIDNPLFGVGFFVDRYYLDGTYPHNLILELFLHFGIPLGLFLFIGFFFYSIYILSSKNDSEFKLIYMLYFSYALGHLLISGSYLTSWALAGCLGLMLSNSKRFIGERS